MSNQTRNATIGAVAIAAVAWIDPLYLPLILLGPVASGLVAGAAGAAPRTMAATWFAAGILVLLTDLLINHEDVAFHAVVAAITAALAGGAAMIGARRRKRTAIA
jgi:hypothetical protein